MLLMILSNMVRPSICLIRFPALHQAKVDEMRLERAELLQKLSAASAEAEQARTALITALEDCGTAKSAADEAYKEIGRLTKQRDSAWAVRTHLSYPPSGWHGRAGHFSCSFSSCKVLILVDATVVTIYSPVNGIHKARYSHTCVFALE
jgi:hypothetical protein